MVLPLLASAVGRRATEKSVALAFCRKLLIRTNVYVDGFNLYYRALRETPNRWLDIGKLARLLLPQHRINRIRYFTAVVTSRPNDPNQAQRQQTYLRALRTVPNLSIHYGHFLSKTKRRPLAQPPESGSRIVEVLDTEEERLRRESGYLFAA